MPGQDVTPRVAEQISELPPEDSEAASAYKRRQDWTNEEEFLGSLNEKGIRVYERVLALGKQEGMHINWGRKGFSLNAVSNGANVVICYGFPPSAYNMQIYTAFAMIGRKTRIPHEDIEGLRRYALDTNLFVAIGSIGELSCQTDRKLDEAQLATLVEWLGAVVVKIREFETVNTDES